VLLIPITLILAAILPGNRLLPLADLAFLGFWVATPMAMFRNNIVRGVIYGTVAMAISLYMATAVAPLVTQLGVAAGTALPEGTAEISMLTIYPWGWFTSWIASLFTGGF
jgi:PTS system galactitol-specific IIC component